jgi:hypothetical protein
MNRTTRRTPLGDIGNTLLTQRDLVARKPGSPRADEKHRSNPLFAVDYVKDVYDHFKRIEGKTHPSVTYMSTHTEVNEKMRGILIDWLVDVHMKFKLLPETLHLAVDILDRYLEQRTVPKLRLQLVGVVAMLLAAKYEEMYPPEIREFLHVSADAFTRDEVLRMERQMLAVLNFNLTVPTIYPFLLRGLQVLFFLIAKGDRCRQDTDSGSSIPVRDVLGRIQNAFVFTVHHCGRVYLCCFEASWQQRPVAPKFGALFRIQTFPVGALRP